MIASAATRSRIVIPRNPKGPLTILAQVGIKALLIGHIFGNRGIERLTKPCDGAILPTQSAGVLETPIGAPTAGVFRHRLDGAEEKANAAARVRPIMANRFRFSFAALARAAEVWIGRGETRPAPVAVCGG